MRFLLFYLTIVNNKKNKSHTRLNGRVGCSLSQLPDRLNSRVVQQLDVKRKRAEVSTQLVYEQSVKGLGRVVVCDCFRGYFFTADIVAIRVVLFSGHRHTRHQRIAVVGSFQTVHKMHQRQLCTRHVILGHTPLPHGLHSTIVVKT